MLKINNGWLLPGISSCAGLSVLSVFLFQQRCYIIGLLDQCRLQPSVQCEQVDQLPMNGCLRLKKQLSPVAVRLFALHKPVTEINFENGNDLCKSPALEKMSCDQRRPQCQATLVPMNCLQFNPGMNQTCYFTSFLHACCAGTPSARHCHTLPSR